MLTDEQLGRTVRRACDPVERYFQISQHDVDRLWGLVESRFQMDPEFYTARKRDDYRTCIAKNATRLRRAGSKGEDLLERLANFIARN